MKKKVLFIIWTFSLGGGAEKILSNIVNNLDKNKYEIDILEYINFNIKKEEISENVKVLEPVMISNKNEKSRLKQILDKFILQFFPNILRRKYIKKNYDIEVAFNYLIPTFLLTKNKSIKKLAWFHGSIEDLDYHHIDSLIQKIKSLRLYYLQKKALSNLDRVVAISNKTYESIEKIYPEARDKLIKIYNGYDFNSILMKSDQPIDLNYEGKLIIAIGRLDKNKNFSLLIKAVEILKDQGKICTLLILGEGEDREKLEELIENRELTQNVKLLGYVGNPYPYIKRAEVICLTSFSEGFPTVLVEAMVLGCPFVSTNVGGVEELSQYGKCGIVVEWSENSIAEGITKIVTNTEIRQELSKNCKIKAMELSLEKQVKKIEMLFDS